MSANAPHKFKPIGLKRNQFGVIAFIVFLAVWVTCISAVSPVLHVLRVNIGISAPLVGRDLLVVEINETSEVNVNGEPLTLNMLTHMVEQMRWKSHTIILKPDACAPYDAVVKTIAAIKRGGADITFAPPDYSTRFESGLRKANYSLEKREPSHAIYSNGQQHFQTRTIRTVILNDECQRKVKPSSLLDTPKNINRI